MSNKMIDKKINLCLFNFENTNGIEDYIDYFKRIFEKKLIINKKFSDEYNNIIIEDFTSPDDVQNLIKYKKNNPNAKLTLVLTEFINQKLKTFNNFDQNIDNQNFILNTMKDYQRLKKIRLPKIMFKILIYFKLMISIALFRFKIIKNNKYQSLELILNAKTSLSYLFAPRIIMFLYAFTKNLMTSKNKYNILKIHFDLILQKKLVQKYANCYYFKIRYLNAST